MTWLALFFVFFKTGLFALGGAYSFIPLLEKEVVERREWMDSEEFLEISGITTVFPGAISVKYATYVGYKQGGAAGAAAANIGNFLPPAFLIMAFMPLYLKYRHSTYLSGSFEMVRIAVFAMIVAAGFKLMGAASFSFTKTVLGGLIFGLLFLFGGVHPALIIIAAAVAGLFI